MDILKSLMRGKTPGLDGVLNKMIMYGGGRMVDALVDLLQGVSDVQ